MRHVGCDVCGADDATVAYVAATGPGTLHDHYVRCRGCGFVYADPRAEPAEATAFYAGSHGGAEAAGGIVPDEWRRAVEGRISHLRSLRPDASGPVRFLDVGFGDASSLAAAAGSLGWRATGIELDPNLVDAARSRVAGADIHVADVTEFEPGEPFDVVYSWHTIEHVLDVNAWLAGVRRVLRPGGILLLGTENAASAYAALWSAPYRALGRTPPPPTSTEHTYWFEPRHLEQLLSRHGFENVRVRAYENGPLSVIRGLPTWRPLTPTVVASKLAYLASAVIAVPAPVLGGKIEATATACRSLASPSSPS